MTFNPDSATIWADGPSSSPAQPPKPQIRQWSAAVEAICNAFTTNAGLIFATKALMNAQASVWTEPRSAWVYADSTPANNGVYVLNPSTDTWTKVGRLPYDFVIGTDTGAGTANAIQATTSIPVSESALVLLNVFEANTGSPVTVSFNGGSSLTIKTNTGNDVAAGGLVAGMLVLGRVSGSTFRLASDQASATVLAAAEQAVSDAQAIKDSIAPGTVLDGSVSEEKVVADPEDALRITISNLAYPRRYGDYEPGGEVDYTAALNAAASSKKFVEVGEGLFKTTSTINVGNNGTKLIGYGPGCTEIKVASTSAPVLSFADDIRQVTVEGITLSRTGTPVVGASGVEMLGICHSVHFQDLYVVGHYDGARLRGAGYSTIRDCVFTNNLSDGVEMWNSSTNELQWYLDGLLLQVNGERGLFCRSVAGPAAVALGDWNNIRTYANTGPGVAVIGSSTVPIHGIRMSGGSIGGDGANEIYLDTYGHSHVIRNVFLELAGTQFTGPQGTTPPSGIGYGLIATPNNEDVRLLSSTVFGCSSGGVDTSASVMTRISDTKVKNNGGFGVLVADGSKYAESNCDFSGNTGNPRSFTTNGAKALIVGSTPAATQPTQIPGGMAVGEPVGGNPSAGLINVSAGLLKNNTAYNNP